MYQKDRLKVIIAITILICIALGFWLWGKAIAKYIALAGISIWLISMYLLNTRNKNS